MFYGFLSERLPLLPTKKVPAVSKKGFHLFLDLSDKRSFLLERPKITLVFWGRIYGQSDLLALFEPLVKSYEQDRDSKKIFSMLEGDFSLVLFDHDKKVAYLGRDRFARGEIYWCTYPLISFFTHPFLFFRIAGIRPALNLGPLWDRFAIGATTPPETIYQDVFTTVTGEYVEMDANGDVKRIPYWSPLQFVKEEFSEKTEDSEYLIKEFRRCFIQKVSEEIAPYKKLGVGLSGGLDSSAIMGAARKNFTGDIVAVTVGPDGPSSPDLPRARKSAGFNNAHHIEYYPKAIDLEDFPSAMGGQVQPFRSAASFMNHRIAKAVKDVDGECVLWGLGADLIFGNAGYCRRFFNKEGGVFPAEIISPVISILQCMPQTRLVVGVTHRLMWQRGRSGDRLGEKYFRVCKKPRFFQEKRLFRKEFLSLGREDEIVRRVEDILDQGDNFMVERLLEVDFKVVHMYNQVSAAHQICRLNGLDSIITYYNKDYAELNLMATNRIRGLDGWNKYVLREAFRPLVHKDIYSGNRRACVIRWDRIISGPLKKAVIRYLRNSSIVREIFKTAYLDRLGSMIKHPGLMYLNLLGLALWHDINFNGVSPDTPLSAIIDYSWQSQDK